VQIDLNLIHFLYDIMEFAHWYDATGPNGIS